MTDKNSNEPSFEELLDAAEMQPGDMDARPGDTVSGVVVLINKDNVFIDWGGKGEGWAETAEFKNEEDELSIAVGDQVELKLLEFGRFGAHLGTRFRATPGGTAGLRMLEEAYESGMAIEGTVQGVNKGGFDISFAGAQAFCPISQIDNNYCEEPEVFLDTTHSFRVIEFDEDDRRVVVSRRVLLEEERLVQAEKTREQLELDAEFTAEVRKIMPYGVFVDFGGLEGFIHISEIAHERVEDPADFIHPGDKVEVKVISIKTDQKGKERIGLSRRALLTDPWEKGLPFTVDETIKGIVRRIEDFGAFVELTPGVDGLLHISEIALERIGHPSEKLTVGQEIDIFIKAIDTEKRRITLSIRSLLSMAAAENAAVVTAEDEDDEKTRTGNVIRRRKSQQIEAVEEDQDKIRELSEDEAWADADSAKEEPVSKDGAEDDKEKVSLLTPKIGLNLEGIIRTVMPYGIFVDLPACGPKASGLLHKSETNSGDTNRGFTEGETLEVEIVKIDENGRIGLSQKAVTISLERAEMKKFQEKTKKEGSLGSLAGVFGNIKLKK